ncbi:MAG: CHAT domain-containing protein [Nostoc sp.]|uniref:CHAT domain-containing protein n=1 Tax=Nostoc sp. TaxID=1180 RepID=UPI002FEEE112
MSKNYYTYRIRIANYERVQVEKRDTQNQLLGEPYGLLRYKDKLEEMMPLLQMVLNDGLKNSKQARTIGETLFKVLFDDVLCQDFVNFHYQVVQQENHFLRVELDIDEQQMPDLSALPWEFMCLPISANLGEIWIGTDPNLVFSRRRAQWHPSPPIQLAQGEKLRIALAIAAPNDLGPVEFDTVQTFLNDLANNQSEHIELLPVLNPATPNAIDHLLAKQPHIFHFIGHGRLQNEDGEVGGEIALVKKVLNKALWVDASFFSGLFNQHRPGIVLLQACESGMQSDSQAFVSIASRIVQQNIPVVVGMQYKISNIAASQFAYEFYERLGQYEPVDIAVQNSRRTLALETQYRKPDFATPVIFMRVQDGYLFKRQDIDADEKAEILPISSKYNTRKEPNNIGVYVDKGDVTIRDIHM